MSFTRHSALLLIGLSLFMLPTSRVLGCSTFLATPKATVDSSMLLTHSNDGDGDSPGNILRVNATSWPTGSLRPVSGGAIPQVPNTFAYFTEGYAIMNEFQLTLGESTCTSRFPGGGGGILNIVDLGKLALERARTANEAIQVMGSLSTQYGYNDAGESLLVSDPLEAYIFHITPDSSGKSSIWIAQRVPDGHIAAVMNAFTIRDIVFDGSMLFSDTLLPTARLLGWDGASPLDFTATFSGLNEATCKYSSGRRMWSFYNTFAPSLNLSPYYNDYTTSAPYPATVAPDSLLNVTQFIAMMRDQYEGTPFSLSSPVESGGAFSTSSRWSTPQLSSDGSSVCWERPISTYKSIVSFVAQGRSWLPDAVGGTLWFSPHSSRAGCYVPLAAGQGSVPRGYSDNQMGAIERGKSAFWAFKYLFNILEIKANYMLQDVRSLQHQKEAESLALQKTADDRFLSGGGIEEVESIFNSNAVEIVSLFWQLSDTLIMQYADGFCNGCGKGPHHLGYPQWFLNEAYVPPADVAAEGEGRPSAAKTQ